MLSASSRTSSQPSSPLLSSPDCRQAGTDPQPRPHSFQPHDLPPHQERDWTLDLPDSDHVRFFRATDWAKSKLGPLREWGHTLQLFTRMVFADSRAACLWWGPDLVAIYNETYMPLAAHRHPMLMGATFTDGYPDLTGIISYFEEARSTGRGIDYSSSVSLLVERRGWREEGFFSGNFVPLSSGPTTLPEGFYNSLVEVTAQKLADRRTMMLNRMAAVPHFTPKAAAAHIIDTLKTNGFDITLAMLYEADGSSEPTVLRLRGHIGLPEGHDLIVDGQDINSAQGLIPDCRRAGSDAIVIPYDQRFKSVFWQGFGTPSRKIAILPLTGTSRVFGYLIVGANPHRPDDDAHCRQFTQDLSRMSSSIMSAAIDTEASKKREHRLQTDLAFSDMKLRHLIEHASVGMVHISLDGHLIWANDHYYALSGATQDEQMQSMQFLDVYLEEDKPKAEDLWTELVNGTNHINAELRLKRLYTTPTGNTEPAQIQAFAFPYRESGQVKSVMACTTDISKLKWAQNFQAKLAAEAREAKRQQEAFIDVVSHEMRNPLSAIVHCADEISHVLEDLQSKLAQIPKPCIDALTDNVASANIIMQCANHQKRIIDDILTLSKLDSMLLSITPSAVRPSKLIASIVGIFDAELKHNKIHSTFAPDNSLDQLDIEFIYLDPSRVTQIFINLLTNAIKFVKPSKNPEISIHFGASLSDPRAFFPEDMFWATKSKDNGDVTGNVEWGTGEEIYLMFTIKDSGIGMREQEIHKIFERFRQANMRTHVKYGGSGLGLFISKELTEKQGGEIGVSSTPGQGSIFGFYVRTRRVASRPQTIGRLSQISASSQTLQQLQVLLVEDNVINQQVLGKQLKKAGCIVEVANHGVEALEFIDQRSFDVVLMDMEMPVLNGIDAIQEIRKRERDSDGLIGARIGTRLPIIAVTANVRPEQMDHALAAGAVRCPNHEPDVRGWAKGEANGIQDRVMQKPFKAADLVHMIHGLIPPDTDLPTPGMDEMTRDLFS